jgi:hypothetical protein
MLLLQKEMNNLQAEMLWEKDYAWNTGMCNTFRIADAVDW